MTHSIKSCGGDGLSDCKNDSTKDVEEEKEKDKEILQGDFMEESETTENEHVVLKTVTSVTKDKQKIIVGNAHLLNKNQKQTLTLKQ